MADIEFYWGSGSPYAWRVHLALELKHLPYTSKLISFSAGEHKAPEYLALNPRGKVPTIRYGDIVVHESLAILAWLDGTFPAVPLFGRDPASDARIWTRALQVENYGQPTNQRYVRPIFFGQQEAHRADIEAAIPKVRGELAVWDDWAKSEWLAGDRISAVDLMVLPSLETLLRANGKPAASGFDLDLSSLADVAPNLARWHAQMKQLPAYEATFPPHWR